MMLMKMTMLAKKEKKKQKVMTTTTTIIKMMMVAVVVGSLRGSRQSQQPFKEKMPYKPPVTLGSPLRPGGRVSGPSERLMRMGGWGYMRRLSARVARR